MDWDAGGVLIQRGVTSHSNPDIKCHPFKLFFRLTHPKPNSTTKENLYKHIYPTRLFIEYQYCRGNKFFSNTQTTPVLDYFLRNETCKTHMRLWIYLPQIHKKYIMVISI